MTDKAQWEAVWAAAEKFFQQKVDVLVNNAGVSPMLGFDLCMKVEILGPHVVFRRKCLTDFVQINLDGVLQGCSLFEEKQGRHHGGPGGLVVNIASCAGLTWSGKHSA